MKKKTLEMRLVLIEAIEKAQEENEDLFTSFGWWGENQTEHMVDAAISVLLSSQELQKYMRENNLKFCI